MTGGPRLSEMETLARIPGVLWHVVPSEDGHGCWVWLGRRTGRALRPAVVLPGARTRLLARIVWAVHHGQPVPPRCHVVARCGRVTCVRPSHLVARPVREVVSLDPRRSTYRATPRRSRSLVTSRVTNSEPREATGEDGTATARTVQHGQRRSGATLNQD